MQRPARVHRGAACIAACSMGLQPGGSCVAFGTPGPAFLIGVSSRWRHGGEERIAWPGHRMGEEYDGKGYEDARREAEMGEGKEKAVRTGWRTCSARR